MERDSEPLGVTNTVSQMLHTDGHLDTLRPCGKEVPEQNTALWSVVTHAGAVTQGDDAFEV